jgi:hypothetical protein
MSADEFRGPRRETRLLFLVVLVSLAVLLLVARFRFPASDLSVVAPTSGPLTGLAARAAFDDMAATLRTLVVRVTPLMTTVTLEPSAVVAAQVAPAPMPLAPHSSRTVAALRVRPTLGLVGVWSNLEPVRAAGNPTSTVATDEVRRLAVIQLDSGTEWTGPVSDSLLGMQFVAAIGATARGLTVQPVFIGRVDPVLDDRWPAALLTAGEILRVPVGAFLFSLDGRLLGLTMEREDDVVVVPATVLDAVVADLTARGGGE